MCDLCTPVISRVLHKGFIDGLSFWFLQYNRFLILNAFFSTIVECIQGILAQIDLALTLTIFEFFYHVIYYRASQKNAIQEVFDFFEKFFGVNITQNNSKN